MTFFLMVASPRAALLGGIVPILIIAGIAILALAAPSSKERLAEAKALFGRIRPQADAATDTEEAEKPRTWTASAPEQYSEFYGLIAPTENR